MNSPDTDTLNAAHGIPHQLRFDTGAGGWPCAHIHNEHATGTVSLHGAQVLSYTPAGEADLLFLSEQAVFQPGKAIRGGVPVCWPWFGPDPQGLGRPAHGLARTRGWAVEGSATTPEGATCITLTLRDSADTLALWPHAFRLTLSITVGRTLRLALDTHNTGTRAFELTQALHSYLAVGDAAAVRVHGLDGCDYLDKAAGARGTRQHQQGAVGFSGEVDRIYIGAPAALQLEDPHLQRRLQIRSEGSRTAVVWNPGAALAAGMADLPDDAWRHFVCVETANAGDEVITLAPGGHHRLVAEMGVCD